MEAANEAARRAVNAIIDAAEVAEDYCQIWALEEPWVMGLWRWIDGHRYARGLPWRDTPWVVSTMGWITLTVYHVFVRAYGKVRNTSPRKARALRK